MLVIVLFRRTNCRQIVNIRFQDTHNKQKKPPVKFNNNVCSGENRPIPSRVTERSAESDTKRLLVKY